MAENIDLLVGGRFLTASGPEGGFQEKDLQTYDGIIEPEKIATGYGHTLIIDKTGNISSYGESAYGQLGYVQGGNTGYISAVNRVIPSGKSKTRFVSVSTARRHSVAVDERGNVWVWGKVKYPKYTRASRDLPYEKDKTLYMAPRRVTGLTEVTDVVCGSRFILALDEDGVVWKTLGFSSPDEPQDLTKFEKITGIPLISKISAGARHVLLLEKTETRADKEQPADVYVLGSNKAGQLGNPDLTFAPDPIKLSPVSWCKAVDISCGSRSSFVTDSRGSIWVAGSNKYGCLGFNPTTLVKTNVPYFIENKALYYKRIVLQRNRGTILTNEIGTVTHIGKGTPFNIPYNDPSVKYVSGNPNPEARKLPSQVVSAYKERILNVTTADGKLYVSGFHSSNKEGDFTIISDYQVPYHVRFNLRIVSVFGGYEHTLMVDEIQSVWAFGSNTSLQCAQSINIEHIKSPVLIEFPREQRYNIAPGTTDDPEEEAIVTMNDFHIISVACGPDFSVFVTIEGDVWVCGKTSASILDGSIFKSELQKVPSIKNIIQAAAGKDNVALIDSEGNIHISGFSYSEPTLEDTISRYSSILLYSAYGIPVDDNDDGAKEFVQVSCGENHLLVTDDKGDVWGIGSNTMGQLGVYSEKPHFFSTPIKSDNVKWKKASRVYCNGNSSYIFDADMNVWVIGSNDVGKVDKPNRLHSREEHLGWRAPSLDKMKIISTGYNATLFLNTKNETKTFGDNRTNMLCVDNRIPTEKPGIINTPSTYLGFEFSSPENIFLEKVTIGKKRRLSPKEQQQQQQQSQDVDSDEPIAKKPKKRILRPIQPSSNRSKILQLSQEGEEDENFPEYIPKSQGGSTFIVDTDDEEDLIIPKSRILRDSTEPPPSGTVRILRDSAEPPPSGIVREERKNEEPLWESSENIPNTGLTGTDDDPMFIGCNVCPDTHRYRCRKCHRRFHLGGLCHIRHLKVCHSHSNECHD